MVGALAPGLLLAAPAYSVTNPNAGLSLEISPAIVPLNTDPGRTVTNDLRVRNAGNAVEHLKIAVYKFTVNDDGQILLANRGPNDDFFDWIHLSPQTNFDVLPNEWHQTKLAMDIPKNAAFDYNIAIVYQRQQEEQPQGGQAVYNAKVGSLVLLEVNNPNAKRQIDIADFSTSHRFFEYLPADFTVKLQNSGNVYAVPTGNVFISRGDSAAATLDINPHSGRVLAGSGRFFNVQWDDGFPKWVDKTDASGQVLKDKNGNPQRRLQWDWNQLGKFRFGKYTARLLMVYDNGQRDIPVEATLTFFVLPWRLMLGALLVILIVGWGLYSNLRNLTRRMRQR